MIYLLAKYTFLFLLTAILGFVLGYWFSRRNFEDVSESYEDLRKANARSDADDWSRLWDRLDALPKPKDTDLSGVLQGISGVQAAVSNLPAPEPVDLEPIETRLDSLTERVRKFPLPIVPEPVDFKPLHDELSALHKDIKRMPVVETHAAVDLTPLHDEVTALHNDLKRMPVIETHAPVDLTPIGAKIESVHRAVGAIPRPQPVDLQPIDRRLRSIETELGKVNKRVAALKDKPARKQRVAPAGATRKVTRDQPRVLSAALYGKKDDLQKISGVGPKLEKLLNSNGVFYFWQVAEWNKRDIDIIDERLDTFKGRISRDNWVHQARQLRRAPGAASMPKDV